MSEKINLFFESMAERLTNENDLSDITYALCKTDEDFRKFFLEYCFESPVDTDNLIREYADEGSRPDFYFIGRDNNEYLIEVKIYDRNQHFDQYNKQFPNANYAYISNYILNDGDLCDADRKALPLWKLKTWLEFYEKLSESGIREKELVAGYLSYLREVIHVREFEKMDITKISCLPIFIGNIEKVANDKGFSTYSGAKAINECYYGRFFQKESFYFWYGLYLPEESIYIGLKNHESWITSEVKDELNKNLKEISESEFSEKPFYNSDGNYGDYWFKLKNDKYNILEDESQKDKQFEILQGFLTSVMKSIGIE